MLALLICGMNLQNPVLYLLMPNMLFSELIRPPMRAHWLSSVYLILCWYRMPFKHHIFSSFHCKECIIYLSVARTQCLMKKVIQLKGKAGCPCYLLAEPQIQALLLHISFKQSGPVNLLLHKQRSSLIPVHLSKTA